MKILSVFLQKLGIKRTNTKTLAEYKEELLFRQGSEQFKKLIQRGLTMPIQVL